MSRRRPLRSITSPRSSARPSPSWGDEPAELVAGVRLSQRHRSRGCLIARKDPRAFVGIESTGIQTQFFSQLTVELDQPGLRHLRRLPSHIEALKFTRIGIVESNRAAARLLGTCVIV